MTPTPNPHFSDLKEPPAAAPLFSGRQWQQVLARDTSADGQFVYAVKTTRIYCRPGCASRRPARKNVAFFPTAAAAEHAGFRPCKRCEPQNAQRKSDPQAPLVDAALRHLASRPAEQVRLDELAQVTGASRLTLLRAFRRVLGVTPREYARAQRIERFSELVRSRPAKDSPARAKAPRITEALYEAGFGSSSRLYETSQQALGMTPTRLQQGAEGLTIRYTTAACSLGRVLVAATETGVCAILLASTDEAAASDLRKRFPKAQLVAESNGSRWLNDGVAFVLSQTTEHPLAVKFPLDVRATAFQQRVWKALQQIPRGETRSYSDVARDLGRPSAVRAVAAAIGSNPIALAIPCHRVVGQDGALTGYRWGLDRKQKLLRAEGSLITRRPNRPAAPSSPTRLR